MDVDKWVNCTQRILRGPALKKYKKVLVECKELVKGIAGYQWIIGPTKDVTMEQLCTWGKQYYINISGGMYLVRNICIEFDKDIWFKLGKIMLKRHRIILQDHVKYIHNDIVKPFRVSIIQYAECICEMHDLVKYFPPHSKKGVGF